MRVLGIQVRNPAGKEVKKALDICKQIGYTIGVLNAKAGMPAGA
jgi:hypothetical protein